MTEKLTADWGADSHSGSRIVNEDFIAFTRYDDETEIAKKGICLVVTDGSASVRCGQRAAQMSAFKILESYYGRQTIQDPKLALRTSLENALTLLDRESIYSKCDGMAVSIAAAAIFNGLLHVAWVGDARAYVLRNGQIMSLTTVGDTVQDPRFLLGPARGILETSKSVESGDRIILCTDGIYRVLNDNAIATLASNPVRPEDAAQALIQGALAQHTNDNASAIVFDNGTAMVKHTPKPQPAVRPNMQWIPLLSAALGIILFVAGSATLLSRRTIRNVALAPSPVATNATQALSALLIDPSAGIPEATQTTQDTASNSAAIPAAEIAPSETSVPPTVTPQSTETKVPATAPTTTRVTTATGVIVGAVVTRVEMIGNSTQNGDIGARPATRAVIPTSVRPTSLPSTVHAVVPKATARPTAKPTRRAPPRVLPTVVQPTTAPTAIAAPTDAPKPTEAPPPPPPPVEPTAVPPPPPTPVPPPTKPLPPPPDN